jgi:hypothetical protein
MRLNGWQRIGLIALVALVAPTSVAEATCGDRGGPGYRAPNGKCVGWEELGRVCGSPPSTRCTSERTAPAAPEAARIRADCVESHTANSNQFIVLFDLEILHRGLLITYLSEG